MKSSTILLPFTAFLLTSLGMVATQGSPLELHVSPKGKPQAQGTTLDPFRSPAEALEAFRALPAERRTGGVTILLGEGLYPMPDGLSLKEGDSGTPGAPLVISAEPGAMPILTAGHSVSGNILEPVTDPILLERFDPAARAHVREIDLAKLGIASLKPLPEVFHGNWKPLQVVFGTNTLPISRWPNGEYGFTTMKSVSDNGNATHGGTFVYLSLIHI